MQTKDFPLILFSEAELSSLNLGCWVGTQYTRLIAMRDNVRLVMDKELQEGKVCALGSGSVCQSMPFLRAAA